MTGPLLNNHKAKTKSPANGAAAGGAKIKSSEPKFTRDALAALQRLYGSASQRTG